MRDSSILGYQSIPDEDIRGGTCDESRDGVVMGISQESQCSIPIFSRHNGLKAPRQHLTPLRRKQLPSFMTQRNPLLGNKGHQGSNILSFLQVLIRYKSDSEASAVDGIVIQQSQGSLNSKQPESKTHNKDINNLMVVTTKGTAGNLNNSQSLFGGGAHNTNMNSQIACSDNNTINSNLVFRKANHNAEGSNGVENSSENIQSQSSKNIRVVVIQKQINPEPRNHIIDFVPRQAYSSKNADVLNSKNKAALNSILEEEKGGSAKQDANVDSDSDSNQYYQHYKKPVIKEEYVDEMLLQESSSKKVYESNPNRSMQDNKQGFSFKNGVGISVQSGVDSAIMSQANFGNVYASFKPRQSVTANESQLASQCSPSKHSRINPADNGLYTPTVQNIQSRVFLDESGAIQSMKHQQEVSSPSKRMQLKPANSQDEINAIKQVSSNVPGSSTTMANSNPFSQQALGTYIAQRNINSSNLTVNSGQNPFTGLGQKGVQPPSFLKFQQQNMIIESVEEKSESIISQSQREESKRSGLIETGQQPEPEPEDNVEVRKPARPKMSSSCLGAQIEKIAPAIEAISSNSQMQHLTINFGKKARVKHSKTLKIYLNDTQKNDEDMQKINPHSNLQLDSRYLHIHNHSNEMKSEESKSYVYLSAAHLSEAIQAEDDIIVNAHAQKEQNYRSAFFADDKDLEQYHKKLKDALKVQFQKNFNIGQEDISREYKDWAQQIQQTFGKVSHHKKTIVFDLDETLVRVQKDEFQNGYDSRVNIVDQSGQQTKDFFIYIKQRPYLIEMLSSLKQHYELILFTAAQDQYASIVLQSFDGHQYFDHILSRKQCLFIFEYGVYVKDLTILLNNRQLKDIVIVDNKIESYASNLENGIPITDFIGQDDDEMLQILERYLIKLNSTDDVRDVILKDFFIDNIQDMIQNQDQQQMHSAEISAYSSSQDYSPISQKPNVTPEFDSAKIKECVMKSKNNYKQRIGSQNGKL